MPRLLNICIVLVTVCSLLDQAFAKRMSLKNKRKNVLHKMLDKEARDRNDTLMQRLLWEENSDPNKHLMYKPPWPPHYEDMMENYTLPPNLQPGPNESAIDNSDWVREMVPGFPPKLTTKKKIVTTKKRNRTTSKYKKKLAERSSTTLDPEVVERLKNFTVFSLLHLSPPSLEDDTIIPFHQEYLDPNYYTYRSKAWTTTDSTNGSSVEVNTTSSENKTIHDDFNDFDSPMAMENIDRTIGDFNTNLSKLLEIVEHFEELNNDVVAKNKVDYTVDKSSKNNANRIRNLIMNKDENLDEFKERCLFSENTVDVMYNNEINAVNNCQKTVKDAKGSQDSKNNAKEWKNVQFNDYNDKLNEERNEIDNTDNINENQNDEISNERTELIDDILLKYCRENVTDFERNLRNDVYYNTLRSVIELFVKDVLSEKKKFDKIEENHKEDVTILYNDRNENEVDKKGKPDGDLEALERTMKPNIHRVNELKVNRNDVSTVEMNIVTNDGKTEVINNESDSFSQKNVADIVKNIESDSNPKSKRDDPVDSLNEDLTKTDWANSSKNDKVVAEYLLNNKLKQEIKRINSLIDEMNAYNKSLNYSHIKVDKNNSLHEIIEKLREKRNVHIQQRMKRSNDFMTSFFNINTDTKNIQFNELMTYLEEYEKTKLRRQKRWFVERQGNTCGLYRDNHFLEESTEANANASATPYNLREGPRKVVRLKRSKSEEDYNNREAVKRQKKSGSNRIKSKHVNNVVKSGDNVKKMYNQKLSASKEKYYYPREPTHDPGDELWKVVKKDYETNPQIRDIIDKSHSNNEKFESRFWNCNNRVKRSENDMENPKTRNKRSRHSNHRTSSEEEYLEREYKKKMKAEFKKRVLTDESPETTEPTTPDLRWLDCSRSKAKVPIDIEDLGLSTPEEVLRNLKKRDVNNVNNDDVFERYDPSDDDFIENLAQHAMNNQNKRKKRNIGSRDDNNRALQVSNKRKRDINDQETPNTVNDAEQGYKKTRVERSLLLDKLKPRHRRDVMDEKPDHLSAENVHKIPEYDQYHGVKYGQTEVFEGAADLSGMYERYTAASVGPYQKKRYEKFRKFYLDATSTWCDPFIKVSFAVCPFCGDYFGNREKLLFHENYDHFNIFSTVVPVTLEPTATVSQSVKYKDMNDIFEEILKNDSLATASEKWGEFIDENINPTKRDEYRHLLFNKSMTAFITVQGHDIASDPDESRGIPTALEDNDFRVLSYLSDYHKEKNYTYDKEMMKSQKKSFPVVNLYENPENFIKKLVNHEPMIEEEKK
uniref:C2H2-type domain-containing protein n=1 Tax=Cacopsylla melanoneura TaxID=428564 RepID=A0A8D8WUR6_9HEMI